MAWFIIEIFSQVRYTKLSQECVKDVGHQSSSARTFDLWPSGYKMVKYCLVVQFITVICICVCVCVGGGRHSYLLCCGDAGLVVSGVQSPVRRNNLHVAGCQVQQTVQTSGERSGSIVRQRHVFRNILHNNHSEETQEPVSSIVCQNTFCSL